MAGETFFFFVCRKVRGAKNEVTCRCATPWFFQFSSCTHTRVSLDQRERTRIYWSSSYSLSLFLLALRNVPSSSCQRDGLSRSFRADACVSDLSRPSRINAECCLLRPTFLSARSTTQRVGEFPRCTNTYTRLLILFHPRIHRRRARSVSQAPLRCFALANTSSHPCSLHGGMRAFYVYLLTNSSAPSGLGFFARVRVGGTILCNSLCRCQVRGLFE